MICSVSRASGLLATRMLYSSSTTSRSGSTFSSFRTRPVMRSASNSIIAAELLARHALEIAGVVGRGEGVLVAADPQHGLGKLAGRMLAGALEHQMFEKMREPRFAGRLVGGADLVPDHLRDDRRAVIRDHHDLQAIVEREAGRRLGGHRGLGEGAGRRDSERRSSAANSGAAKRCEDIMTCLKARTNRRSGSEKHRSQRTRRG